MKLVKLRFLGFGGSMLLKNRFTVSLGVALFLCTLASADSINVKTGVLPPAAGAYGGDNTYTGHFSTNDGKAQLATSVAYSGSLSPSDNENARPSAALPARAVYIGGVTDYEVGSFVFPNRKYGPTCCAARNWVGSGRVSGTSTPEPGSLMLLSTGLMGIAGMVRRKLLRA
jgi:hypothetical protein